MFNFLKSHSLFCLFLIFFCSSCKDPSLNVEVQSILPSEKEALELLGYSDCHIDSMGISDNYFCLEGDQFIERSSLANLLNSPIDTTIKVGGVTDRQSALNTALMVPITTVGAISVFIDPSFTMAQAGEINTALGEWNASGICAVQFNAVPTHAAANITIVNNGGTTVFTGPANPIPALPGGAAASACFSNGTTPGRFIRYAPATLPTVRNRINTIKHELGHAIGFRHTFVGANDNVTDNCGTAVAGNVYLHGTPNNTDAMSFMRQGLKPEAAATAGDIRMADLAYPTFLATPAVEAVYWGDPIGVSNFYEFNVILGNIDPVAYRTRISIRNNATGVVTIHNRIPPSTTFRIELRRNTSYTVSATLGNYRGDFFSLTSNSVTIFP